MEETTLSKRHWVRRPIIDGKKQCCVCEEVLSLSEFYMKRDKYGKLRYNSRCNKCYALPEDKKRDANIRANYNGFTLVQYNEMFEKQKGLRASCGRPETLVNHGRVMPLAVDHCHMTGTVRGLLCANCNQALGLLGNDPEIIRALLQYAYENVLP